MDTGSDDKLRPFPLPATVFPTILTKPVPGVQNGIKVLTVLEVMWSVCGAPGHVMMRAGRPRHAFPRRTVGTSVVGRKKTAAMAFEKGSLHRIPWRWPRETESGVIMNRNVCVLTCLLGSIAMNTVAESLEDFQARPVRLPYAITMQGSPCDYDALYALSGPGLEYILVPGEIPAKGLELTSLAGRSGATLKPWLMVRHRESQQGAAILLAYSGNWRISFAPDRDAMVFRAVTLPESLEPFESVNGLPIPGAAVVSFRGDWDGGAQALVRYQREKLRRDLGDDWPWVQFNTWYDRAQNIDEPRLLDSVRAAKDLGCELFMVDAGWYGRHDDWSAALGDWRLNTTRLPHGMKPISDAVREAGMRFGMWVEIENANPESPVAKNHPDWYLRDGETLASGRGCLDFGKAEVLQWATEQIDRIVTEYGLDYIKMDFNTNLNEDSERHKGPDSPLSRHYAGLTKLWTHMRERFPKLVIENCSSGSLRHDLLTAVRTDTHWVSDAVGNINNLAMNFAATYIFPPETCNHWTCFPKNTDAMDVQACFNANLMVEPGLSGPVADWSPEIRFHAADRIALYKQIRPIIRNADVYHLTPQIDHLEPRSMQACLYVTPNQEKAVLFAFHGGDPKMQHVLPLRGLGSDALYRVERPPSFGMDKVMEGDELIQGFGITFPHRGASAVIRLTKVAKHGEPYLTDEPDAEGEPAPINGFSVTIPDDAPPTTAVLRWEPLPGAVRYLIGQGESAGDMCFVDECFVPWYRATDLAPGGTTRFRVWAFTEDRKITGVSPVLSHHAVIHFTGTIPLWRVPWTTAEAGWGNVQRNRNIEGGPLQVRERPFDYGIGTHAPSRISFDLRALALSGPHTFRASVGVDDSARNAPPGASDSIFVVVADGKTLFRSPMLRVGDAPVDVASALPSEAQMLTLIVEKGGDYAFDHADWLAPKLVPTNGADVDFRKE